MKVKRFSAVLCVMLTLVSLMVPANAVEAKEKVTDLGDGFYMVETAPTCIMARSGDLVQGTKAGTVYNGLTKIGTFTLTATFDISGATAKAQSASIQGSGVNGGRYLGGTTSRSGNTATGTATFGIGSIEKKATITLTCSPDGTFS